MDIQNIEKNIKGASCLLKALSNDKRLMITCALYKGEKNVGELEKIVGLSQSAYLSILQDCVVMVSLKRVVVHKQFTTR